MQLPALGASITRDGGLSMSGQSQNVSQPGRRVASDQVYYYIAYIDTHDRLITPLDRVKRKKQCQNKDWRRCGGKTRLQLSLA